MGDLDPRYTATVASILMKERFRVIPYYFEREEFRKQAKNHWIIKSAADLALCWLTYQGLKENTLKEAQTSPEKVIEAFIPKEEELEFKNTKVPFLKVATGGKGPPTDNLTAHWLNDLEEGSLFLCRNKQDQRVFTLGMFILIARNWDKAATFLSLHNLSGPDQPLWVDTAEFCKQYKFVDVLEVMPMAERNKHPDSEQKQETTEKKHEHLKL